MIDCPLTKLESIDGSKVQIERTDTGWYFGAPASFTARIKGFRDGIACRIAPGADREVVQLGIGTASSHLCNALYSAERDSALLFTADQVLIEPLVNRRRAQGYRITSDGPLTITVVDDYLRIHRNLPWYQPLNRRKFKCAPAGWCSWYAYCLDITEDEVMKNTDWLAEHLQPFGCEWVQIDDGWQGRGKGFGTNRDWFVTCGTHFPRGMKWIADYIHARGFRAGIWCIPFAQSDTEFFQDHPNLFVRKENGASPGERNEPLPYDWMPADERMFEWAGRYFIDPTGDEGSDYLKLLFELLCKEWGYDYVKIDAQAMMAGLYQMYRRQLADPALDGDRAYRAGLAAIKSVMGPNRFLLNCGAGWSSCGYCEGIRIGGDVNLSWSAMQAAIDATMQWMFLNTLAFYTDPDVVCVREPLPFAQAEVWTTLVGITGQVLMTSDTMYELPDERVELLRRIFPVADIHPMELYPQEATARPGIFALKVEHPGVGRWDVVALFNWGDSHPKTFELSPARIGLPKGEYICLDGWNSELLHGGDGALTLTVPPTACRLVTYWPAAGRPQFVGTSRHLTQGAIDVDAVHWDPERQRIIGSSQVVADDPYIIRLHVPEGFRVATRGIHCDGRLAELVITHARSGKVNWRVDFRRG